MDERDYKAMNKQQNGNDFIADVMRSEYQEKVFNEIKNLKYKIQGLASYIQNDFERMLDDGTTDKEGISDGVIQMELDYTKLISDLNKVKVKARKIMQYHYA